MVLLEGQLLEQQSEHRRLQDRVQALEKQQEKTEARLESLALATDRDFKKWRHAHNSVVCQTVNLKRLARCLEASLPDYYQNLTESLAKRKRIVCDRHLIQPYQCQCKGHKCHEAQESSC